HRPIGMSQLSRNEELQNHATPQGYSPSSHHSIFFQNQPTYQDYRLVKPQFLEETNETLR
ncbi:MAG: hypothetical protein K2X66_18840, partial [Cyanobacteria bacterium]|nr:hypothetical protein [Cyanobacteriota bacterium]